MEAILGTELSCAVNYPHTRRESCSYQVVYNGDLRLWARNTMTAEELELYGERRVEWMGNIAENLFGVCLMAGDLETCRAHGSD